MKILLLSFYYPPLNMTSSNRMSSFVKHLTLLGNEVTVITRHYDEKQRAVSDLLVADSPPAVFNAGYYKSENIFYTNYSETSKEMRLFRQLPSGLRGIYNYYKTDVYHYGWMDFVKKIYEKELAGKKFDFIIASSPPFIVWAAADMLSKLSQTPWIADMRDSFITEIDNRYHALLKSFFYKRLLSKAAALLYVSEGMKEFVESHIPLLRKKPNELIYNGIEPPEETGYDTKDEEAIIVFNGIKSRASLVLLHTGSLYPKRNLDVLLNFVLQYNAGKPAGLKPVIVACAGLQEEFIHRYRNHADAGYCVFFKKVAYSSSLYLQKHADALLLPVWENGYTEFSGKVFEYLYSGNLCLANPKPKHDLHILLKRSRNIYYAETYPEFREFITGFSEGKIAKKPVENKEMFLRSFHVKKMNDFLNRLKQNPL